MTQYRWLDPCMTLPVSVLNVTITSPNCSHVKISPLYMYCIVSKYGMPSAEHRNFMNIVVRKSIESLLINPILLVWVS